MSQQVYLGGGFGDAKQGTNAEGNELCNYHMEVLSRGSHENRLSGAKHRREFIAIELRKDTEQIGTGRARSETRARVHE
jgi:hypothetical protein